MAKPGSAVVTFPIAHRGLATSARENSLDALGAALAFTHVLEIDVRCTSDHVPVLAHDASLRRTHGIDARIDRSTLATLQQLAPDVPTLAEAIDFAHERGGALMLDVKITQPRDIAAIEHIVAGSPLQWNNGRQLRRGEPIDPGTAIFQSTVPDLLRSFRARTGAGCLELVSGDSRIRELAATAPFISVYAHGVTIPERIATPRLVRLLRLCRLGTYVYTVNDLNRYRGFVNRRVSAVFTDAIDEFVEGAEERG